MSPCYPAIPSPSPVRRAASAQRTAAVPIGGALRHAFGRVLAEPLPRGITDLLDRLG